MRFAWLSFLKLPVCNTKRTRLIVFVISFVSTIWIMWPFVHLVRSRYWKCTGNINRQQWLLTDISGSYRKTHEVDNVWTPSRPIGVQNVDFRVCYPFQEWEIDVNPALTSCTPTQPTCHSIGIEIQNLICTMGCVQREYLQVWFSLEIYLVLETSMCSDELWGIRFI